MVDATTKDHYAPIKSHHAFHLVFSVFLLRTYSIPSIFALLLANYILNPSSLQPTDSQKRDFHLNNTRIYQ